MNAIYRDLVYSRVQSAVNGARAIANVSSPLVKGQIREVLMRDLFRPFLPSDFGVGSGVIISAKGGQQSREQDIVIYNRRILPPMLFEGSLGIFPVESVLFTVEVKSRLTSTQLTSAHDSAASLTEFEYQPGLRTPEGDMKPHLGEKLISSIIALDTDLADGGKSEIERYDGLRGEEEPPIRALCVVGRGYWFWRKGKWNHREMADPLGEVMGFLSLVMNTYQRVAESRGQPNLGWYLVGN